jgi:hypothetical protein
MTVAASILLAAVVGGVVFVLIDGWQRREDPEPVAVPPAPQRRPQPRVEAPPRPAPAPVTPRPDAPRAPSPLWSGWADRDRSG